MRKRRIEFRVNESEYEAISLKALNLGYKSVSDFVRTNSLDSIKCTDKKENVRTKVKEDIPPVKPIILKAELKSPDPRPRKGPALSFLD